MADYSLVDAGGWRRLERFGAVVIDRPAPGAGGPVRRPEAWSRADASFDHEGGWQWLEPRPSPWLAAIDGLTFELGSTDSGQIGLFPEQAPMWRWLADRARPASSVLNLFGYTGGATLAAARAGATVVHVDASRPAVAWARRNAALSGLTDRPVRWIVDDATSFVGREHRRGRRYHGLVLDPPSYGHGDGGRAWRLESGLEPLLDAGVALLDPAPSFVLLTAHTPGWDPARLLSLLETRLERRCESGPLELVAESGVVLSLGAYARWPTR